MIRKLTAIVLLALLAVPAWAGDIQLQPTFVCDAQTECTTRQEAHEQSRIHAQAEARGMIPQPQAGTRILLYVLRRGVDWRCGNMVDYLYRFAGFVTYASSGALTLPMNTSSFTYVTKINDECDRK